MSFTPAKFNTGPDVSETTIVTSTGPFVISWSMKKILKGQKDPYSIKRYTDEAKADNFRFNSDKGIIVALPNEVDMVMKKALQRPTRESILNAGDRSSSCTCCTTARSSWMQSFIHNSVVWWMMTKSSSSCSSECGR